MEANKERGVGGLLDEIIPPRLEDAGLEDCALAPDSIREAFFKAAIAVKSRAPSYFYSDDCEETDVYSVLDPVSAAADEFSEVVIRDAVVVGGDEIDGNRVEKPCVDGLQGLEIEEAKKKNSGNDGEDDEDQELRRPILAEGFA